MIEILAQETRLDLRRSAAFTLGELLDPDRPPRIARLFAGYNPAIANGKVQANVMRFTIGVTVAEIQFSQYFHALSNTFYFYRVLPLGKGDWR